MQADHQEEPAFLFKMSNDLSDAAKRKCSFDLLRTCFAQLKNWEKFLVRWKSLVRMVGGLGGVRPAWKLGDNQKKLCVKLLSLVSSSFISCKAIF